MSGVDAAGAAAARSYTITEVRGCRVIAGALPVDDLVALIGAWTRAEDKGSAHEWFCDALLAQHLGVNLVCGPLHATRAWRALLNISPPKTRRRK